MWGLCCEPDEGTHGTEKPFALFLSYSLVLANVPVKCGALLSAAWSLSVLCFS